MRRKVKFWLLLLLGICLFMPLFLSSVTIQIWHSAISFRGVLFSLSYLVPFLIYCYPIYRSAYKGAEPKYPLVPPEGHADIYFP